MIEILGLNSVQIKEIGRIGPGNDPKLHAKFGDDIWDGIKYDLQALNELG